MAISKTSDHNPRLVKVKCFGDGEIFVSIFSGVGWQTLFRWNGRWLIGIKLLLNYIVLQIAVLEFVTKTFTRHRFGMRSVGFVLSFITFCTLLTLNANTYPVWAAPFIGWTTPILPLFYEWGELWRRFFVDVRSVPLLIFTVAFGIGALVHCIQVYTGNGNHDPKKRGESWIYEQFERNEDNRVSEEAACCIIEPALIALLGLLVWIPGDVVFASVLWVAGSCSLARDVYDLAWSTKQHSMV